MKVTNRQVLIAFWEKHQQTERPLKAWLAEVNNARWGAPSDVVNYFPNAVRFPAIGSSSISRATNTG